MSTPTPRFRERLNVPVSWWLIAAFFVFSVIVAVGFYLGLENGLLAGAISAAIVAAVLIPYGSMTVTVDDQGLSVGPSRVEWRWVAGARVRDAAATRRRLGPAADARAFLGVRPYLNESVEVILDDPADPHPYWLVGTRRPEDLSQALAAYIPVTAQPREASPASAPPAGGPAAEGDMTPRSRAD